MAHVHVQIAIPYKTGLPADVAVNNWSFEVGSTTGTDLAEVGAFLQSFYTDIDSYLSPILDLTTIKVKMYDRADAEPRTPIVDTVFNLGTGNTGGLFPEECAAVLSFRGVYESGEPPARRRGRVFLGPLADTVIVSSGSPARALLNPTFVSTVLSAYQDAWDELTTAGNVHEVWSGVNDEGYTVIGGWMDNAIDTQRRRGVLPTLRNTFTLNP